MSELRQNIATGDWVIMAPERLKGRELQPEKNLFLDQFPEYTENCPFCIGNEERFINVEIGRLGGSENKAWQVLCLENKYQIFSNHTSCPIVPTQFTRDGIYRKFIGCGNHELVIESPKHNQSFATMPLAEVEPILTMYMTRFNHLRKHPNNLLTIIFKNYGKRSGASQQHPHSQIVSMRVVPNHIRSLLDEARRYFDRNGVCVFCEIVKHELEEGKRIIFENRKFISYVPYAAAVPYEVHIIPKVHDSLFGDMHDSEIKDFAECLHVTMRKLYFALSNPDFNMVLRNPPYHLSNVPFYHWHLQICPYIITPGGFELGSHMRVNVVTPEDAAERLRNTDA